MPRLTLAASPLALAAALLATPAFAEDDISVDEDGLTIELADGAIELDLGGKVQFDAYALDLPNDTATSGNFRRVRPDLRVRIADMVSLRAEWEFGRSGGWRNLYAQIEPVDGLTLRGGNFIPPFSMEDIQSSASLPFAERSLSSAIAPGFGLGGQAGYASRRFTLKAGYFDRALDPEEGRAPTEGHGGVARATVLAVDSDMFKLHFGIGGERREFSATDTVRYSAISGTRFARPVLRSDRLADLSSRSSVNGEVAIVHRNIAVQAQYVAQWLEPRFDPEVRARGGYVQASWMVTGQGYRYSRGSGIVSGPRLRGGSMPALEVAARYSRITISEEIKPDLSASAFDLSAGLYVTPWAKVLLNGSAGARRDKSGESVNFKASVLRLQLAF